MTNVRVWFTRSEQYDEDFEIDKPRLQIDQHDVFQALRDAYPLDTIELDDYEILPDVAT